MLTVSKMHINLKWQALKNETTAGAAEATKTQWRIYGQILQRFINGSR